MPKTNWCICNQKLLLNRANNAAADIHVVVLLLIVTRKCTRTSETRTPSNETWRQCSVNLKTVNMNVKEINTYQRSRDLRFVENWQNMLRHANKGVWEQPWCSFYLVRIHLHVLVCIWSFFHDKWIDLVTNGLWANVYASGIIYCNSVSDFGIKAVFNSLEFTKYMYGIYFTCILMSLTLKKMNSVK